ncbi:MAG: hypothetical protein JWQ71_4831 [Pedosphaera sp.]|nr:hypothetical protein [Pedosphaera sp.]
MKRYFIFTLCLFVLSTFSASAVATKTWTNPLSGNWNVATNWTPSSVPANTDTVDITNVGTFTVTITNDVAIYGLRVGASSGVQTLWIDNGAMLNMTNSGTITNSAILVVTNGALRGSLTVETNAQLQLVGPSSKFLYSLNLTNRGTVTWQDGLLYVGSTPTSTILNSGLWQITGDNTLSYGGGATPMWTNSGILRKSAGTGVTYFTGCNFVNALGGLVDVLSGTLHLGGGNTNVIGGSFNVTSPATLSFFNGAWTDAGGAITGTGLRQFVGTTMYLRTNITPGLTYNNGDVYITGTNTFQQAGVITNLTIDGATLRGTNRVDNGTLTMNGGSLPDQLTIQPAGQVVFATAATKLLYNATIINQGTVTWTGGSINVGSTAIFNGGLWQMAGDLTMTYGGYFTPTWTNSGILRKTAGTGNGQMNPNFVNLPGGLVDVLSGTLLLGGGNTNVIGGLFTVTSPAVLSFYTGIWTDAGGVTAGTGLSQFTGGSLYLRTNTVPGLKLNSGDIYITGTNTFQQAGAITNLTIDGASLRGTNRVDNGTLTMNIGSIPEQLTIQPAGQVVFATAATKLLYNATIINQGTVTWTGGSINVGSTVISNGGLWQVAGDLTMSYGGYLTPSWTNSGTLRKTAGTGTSQISSLNFINRPSGLVQVDVGTLQLPSTATNITGTLRLNGGTLNANGTLTFNGGTLDGIGSLGANALLGGTISPGQSGPGLMTFPFGLNLGANATLVMGGNGTVPGTQYDQLSVTGAVSLGNCTLQITSLPNVALGTTFTLIANDGTDAVTGTFNGLPDNSFLTVGSQLFRIHYAGGTGNDVTLVRDTLPQLSIGTLTNGVWRFSGAVTPSSIYTIQASTNLINWTNIGFATGSAGGTFTFADSNAFRFNYRFYRTTN